jgi:hypothetical protein
VSTDAQLELLGRLPEPESLLLLRGSDHAINTFSDLRGASIGIGPEGSGTAYLIRQLFEDPDLHTLARVCRPMNCKTKRNWVQPLDALWAHIALMPLTEFLALD